MKTGVNFPASVLTYFSKGSRWAVLARAGVLIGVIAAIDWRVETNVSLGFLYLFPMLMVGACLERWQIALVGAACTQLVEWFDPFPFVASEGIPRVILVFAAFFGTGLFAYESAKNRRLVLRHLSEVEAEAAGRRDAEEQLRVLVESTPAAIFTLDASGRVLLANEAAHRLLGVSAGTLPGQTIREYLPAVATVPFRRDSPQLFRTEMECRGQRRTGEAFLASVWFSSYQTSSGPRLAAVVMDVSEDLRDREESGLRQFMSSSRVLVATVCHELRNVCSAIGVLHANLGRTAGLAGNEDYRALGTLVEGLERIASLELRQTASEQIGMIDPMTLLDELRVIIEPLLRESEIELEWRVSPALPPIRADQHTLLQVFLNLIKNSVRALEHAERKAITIAASFESGRVVARVIDSGPGIGSSTKLFQPFQPGAEATGLGLFVSRAMVRGFSGDLTCEPREAGCCFAIALLPAAQQPALENIENGKSAAAIAGRSRAVSGELGSPAGRRA
jgi:two-component system sensor kinase FixL